MMKSDEFVFLFVCLLLFSPVFLQMLSRLLNSTHPEDLRAANKLIKEMVQEVCVWGVCVGRGVTCSRAGCRGGLNGVCLIIDKER